MMKASTKKSTSSKKAACGLSKEVVLGGFEPPQTEPKPVVLPLHHRTIAGAKIMLFWLMHKFLVGKMHKFML